MPLCGQPLSAFTSMISQALMILHRHGKGHPLLRICTDVIVIRTANFQSPDVGILYLLGDQPVLPEVSGWVVEMLTYISSLRFPGKFYHSFLVNSLCWKYCPRRDLDGFWRMLAILPPVHRTSPYFSA